MKLHILIKLCNNWKLRFLNVGIHFKISIYYNLTVPLTQFFVTTLIMQKFIKLITLSFNLSFHHLQETVGKTTKKKYLWKKLFNIIINYKNKCNYQHITAAVKSLPVLKCNSYEAAQLTRTADIDASLSACLSTGLPSTHQQCLMKS